MALIEVNLDETPDSIPPISPGEKILEVTDVRNQNDDGEDLLDKNNNPYILADFKVHESEDSDDVGRYHTEFFGLAYPQGRVRFKNFVKACGHAGSGVNVESAELIGCHCKAMFKPGTRKDEAGDTIETAKISKFLWEG